MLAKIHSSAVLGIEAYLVEVEVDVARGLPYYSTVGLPDAAVKESRDRVRAAIKNSGFEFPPKNVTVNLAPANIRKEGSSFDLPIALGILQALGYIEAERLNGYIILGELSLDGGVKPVRGALPIAVFSRESRCKGLVLPEDNAAEASIVEGVEVYPVKNLPQAIEFFGGAIDIKPVKTGLDNAFEKGSLHDVDLSEVKGQQHVKRAIEVAAAGGHNILMVGPPGSGKSMLARRLPTILPTMALNEAIETTKVHSVMGLLRRDQALLGTRPFRSPHHTISDAGLIGGGTIPMPGEVSLAHNGVLFLDELPEFKRNVLEVLRQPLEDGLVTISRAAMSITYPSRFMLAAAMNPCPCGFLTDPKRECTCTPTQIRKYLSRISGPLMDRIDIHVEVPPLKYNELAAESGGEASESVRERVNAARKAQLERFTGDKIYFNAHMTSRHIKKYCSIGPDSARLLEMAISHMGLSARAHNRILKVARTIADLAGAERMGPDHISEAIQYRSLDKATY